MPATRAERIAATQRQRWAGLSPEVRAERAQFARYRAETRWERLADPDGALSPEARAIAGARLRDEHYAARGVAT